MREPYSAQLKGRGDSGIRLLDSGVGQAHDAEHGTFPYGCLDCDHEGVDACYGGGVYFCQHGFFTLTPRWGVSVGWGLLGVRG